MKRMNNHLVLRRVHFIRLHSSLPVLHPAAIAQVSTISNDRFWVWNEQTWQIHCKVQTLGSCLVPAPGYCLPRNCPLNRARLAQWGHDSGIGFLVLISATMMNIFQWYSQSWNNRQDWKKQQYPKLIQCPVLLLTQLASFSTSLAFFKLGLSGAPFLGDSKVQRE